MIVHTILYVADQNKSMEFYSSLLQQTPILHVPGMTQFQMSEKHVLGLMPEAGIKWLLGDALKKDPSSGSGIPRAELYISVQNPESYHDRALQLGAELLSPVQERNWGDRAGYVLDADGHVIAFSS